MRPEDLVQQSILDFIGWVAPHLLPFAIPNASRRTEGDRPTNAVPGLLPGMTDLGIVLGCGRTGFIEVKAARGRLRSEQIVVGERLTAMGAPYAIARGIDDVRAAFSAWNVPTREHAR